MPDPNATPVQPVVTYDGRIICKPVERTWDNKVIPDPSWVKFLRDYKEGR